MIQDEVWHKIKTDADKKSFLWRLLNYAYNINYCKTVWPKSFNPAPKVKSCLVEFFQKEDIIDLSFSWLFEFLDLYSQFSRKTLWAINKILQKQWKKTFAIPEEISKKRLEELNWNNIETMVS
jgi:16S rRNA A1518/A1519 N6-dimethyltransferase RsmA/KsgA/DIM1 with predicted DNA glycosylase/AP lyase activity